MSYSNPQPGNSKIPRHIAIVMDGNGRWAKQRHLPRIAGHKEGLNTVKKIITACGEVGVEVLTLFAFSSENWRRPEEEISGLMNLFLTALQNEIKKLHENNVQVRFIGDQGRFSQQLVTGIRASEQLTAQNTGLKIVIAVDYGGRWDILQSVQTLAQKVKEGDLIPEHITESLIAQHLTLAELPEPDLFIRTSGEQRISNFLLWQLAYTELYFTEIFWPDFNEAALRSALDFYAVRQRRFGYTSEQIGQS